VFESQESIVALLGNTQESGQLEFKSGKLLSNLREGNNRRDLIKSVTSFANAGGGTLIIGVSDDGHSVADDLEPVPHGVMTKDQLAEILSSNCDPPLIDFQISTVPFDNGLVFVVTVEEGHTAFQNRIDRHYYQRVEATTQMMYGFAIRDVMNRHTGAIVRATIDVKWQQLPNDTHSYRIVPRLENIGALTANHWILEIDLPITPLNLNQQVPIHCILFKGQAQYQHWALQRVEYSSERRHHTVDLRLLPGYEFVLDANLGFVELRFEVNRGSFKVLEKFIPPIHWTLYVDNAAKQSVVKDFREWCKY
jgi:hypothetical protein